MPSPAAASSPAPDWQSTAPSSPAATSPSPTRPTTASTPPPACGPTGAPFTARSPSSIALEHPFDLTDGDGAELLDGESFWAALTLGPGSVTVTKGPSRSRPRDQFCPSGSPFWGGSASNTTPRGPARGSGGRRRAGSTAGCYDSLRLPSCDSSLCYHVLRLPSCDSSLCYHVLRTPSCHDSSCYHVLRLLSCHNSRRDDGPRIPRRRSRRRQSLSPTAAHRRSWLRLKPPSEIRSGGWTLVVGASSWYGDGVQPTSPAAAFTPAPAWQSAQRPRRRRRRRRLRAGDRPRHLVLPRPLLERRGRPAPRRGRARARGRRHLPPPRTPRPQGRRRRPRRLPHHRRRRRLRRHPPGAATRADRPARRRLVDRRRARSYWERPFTLPAHTYLIGTGFDPRNDTSPRVAAHRLPSPGRRRSRAPPGYA